MKRISILLIALALIAGVVVVGCGDESEYHITWSPPKISRAVCIGYSWETDVTFTSDRDLSGVQLVVMPELEPFVSVSPEDFDTVAANVPTEVHISVVVPAETVIDQTFEGSAYLKVGSAVYPQSLEVLLYIAAPLDTVTEQAYNRTRELNGQALDDFYELEAGGETEAGGTVAGWLRQQSEVLDAGVLDNGNIWVTYKTGIDSIIFTGPPGVNGSKGLSVGDGFAEDVYSSVSSVIAPGSKKAIVLSPFYSQPLRANGSDEVRDALSGLGYDVTTAYDESVTVNLIKTLYQYGVVDWSTHGDVDFFGKVLLATGEEATWLSELSHWWDLVNYRMVSGTLRYDVEEEIDKDFWCVRPSFIEHYAAQPYPGSLIHTDACHGLGNPTMANAFVENGAYVYLGWNISVYASVATEVVESLYHYLSSGMTVSQAYGNIGDPTAKASFAFYPGDHGNLVLGPLTPVTFPDPNLEAAIREAIGKPTGDIYPSDLAGLTDLIADWSNIADLTGLEYCTGLSYLLLGYNQISDISPLAGLTNLTDLDLQANQISDISPLANLTGLTNLDLYDNQISDLSPLATLTSLTELSLVSNQISDLSPLGALTNLTYLNCCSNQISDISPLVDLTNLNGLWIGYNQISDMSPLAGLTGLTELYLAHNQISDISPLAGLTNLTYLNLHDNQISDISPLVDNAGPGEGDEVNLESNPLSDDSINIYIPELEARGVIVYYDEEGEQVVVRLELLDIPSTLLFDQDFVPENKCEYSWGINIDVDDNPITGDDDGYDVTIDLTNWKFAGETPHYNTIVEGTQHNTWVDAGDHFTWGHEIDVTVDYTSNTITMIASKAWEELSGLDENSRFNFSTSYRAPDGSEYDETADAQGNEVIDDPMGDVPYDFIDIIQGSLSIEAP